MRGLVARFCGLQTRLLDRFFGFSLHLQKIRAGLAGFLPRLFGLLLHARQVFAGQGLGDVGIAQIVQRQPFRLFHIGRGHVAQRQRQGSDISGQNQLLRLFRADLESDGPHDAGLVLAIVRDLVDAAISQTREYMRDEVKAKAHQAAEDRVIEAIAGTDAREATRDMFRKKLKAGELDDTIIELDVADTSNPMPMMDIPGQPGSQMGMMNLGDIFGKAFGGRTVRRRMTVAESYETLISEEADKLLDDETVTKTALESVEENGIVFLDEIDKVCARSDARGGDVSREGVQRDLLPLIEGTTVSTKHGPVKTDHILFIASGAFHIAKPSDLLPELQGRLPIRVELRALTEDDFVRILTETDNALTRQYTALMATEEVTVTFTDDGIAALAKIAADVNQSVENIGARRLYTVMERVFEELSFTAPDQPGQSVTVNAAFVDKNLGELTKSADVSRYVL